LKKFEQLLALEGPKTKPRTVRAFKLKKNDIEGHTLKVKGLAITLYVQIASFTVNKICGHNSPMNNRVK
jgi:hypothetical protein